MNGDGLDDLIVGLRDVESATKGEYTTGKSYVVFGKADGNALSLQAVGYDIGGYVIGKGGESDMFGHSVSSAGDVNGDGFADLIIGAYGTSNRTGQSSVLFGGRSSNCATQQGGLGNDSLTGSALADNIVGGQGDDTVIGNGGKDVLYGGAGDDVIALSDLNFNRIDGGSGTDTLQLDGSNLALDLTKIANNRITGIERIDITGSGNNGLALQKQDVLTLSDQTNQLIVMGNTGDIVFSSGQGWIATGIASLDNNLYIEYTSGGASLLVDLDITRMIS